MVQITWGVAWNGAIPTALSVELIYLSSFSARIDEVAESPHWVESSPFLRNISHNLSISFQYPPPFCSPFTAHFSRSFVDIGSKEHSAQPLGRQPGGHTISNFHPIQKHWLCRDTLWTLYTMDEWIIYWGAVQGVVCTPPKCISTKPMQLYWVNHVYHN